MKRIHVWWDSPIVTSWGSLLSQLLMLVGVLPLVLHEFDAEEVRFWLMLNTLLIFNMICDFGVAPTVSRIYAYALGGASLSELGEQNASSSRAQRTPAWDVIEAITQVCQRIYFVLAVALTLALVVSGIWLVMPLLPKLPNPTDGWVSCLLFLMVQPLGLLGSKYTAYLVGTNHIAPIQRVKIAVSVCSTILMILVLWLGSGLAGLVAVSQLSVLVIFFGNRHLAKNANNRRYKDSIIGRYHPDVGHVVWPRSWRSALGQIFTAGITQLAAAYYAKGVNAGAAAEYLLALRIMATISQFSDVPFYTKLPSMSLLRGQGEVQELTVLARRSMGLSLSLLSLGILAFAAVGEPILEKLSTDVGHVPIELWLSLGFATYLHRFGSMHLQIFSTTNRIMWHWISMTSGIVFVGTSSILFPRIGLQALPLAMVAGYGTIYVPWSSCLSYRSLSVSVWSFEKRAGLPGIIILLLGVLWLLLPSEASWLNFNL